MFSFMKHLVCASQQKTITLFLFISMILFFAMRSSFLMGIVEINSTKNIERTDPPKIYCPGEYQSIFNETGNQVDWTEFQVGVLFSMYYLGYGLGGIIGAVTTMAINAKYTFFSSIFGTSLLNLCFPYAILSNIFSIPLFIKFMMGLCQGCKYPAIADLLVNWVPQDEFQRSFRFVFVGALFGNTFGTILTSVAIYFTQSWSFIFYCFGGIGIIVSILFLIYCYNEPDQHPFISTKERQYLNRCISVNGRSKFNRLSNIPWRELFRTKTLALIPAQYGNDFVFVAFGAYIPKYYAGVFHISLFAVTGYTTLLNFSVFLVVTITRLSVRNVQQKSLKFIFNILAYLPPVLFSVGTYHECDVMVTTISFTIGAVLCGLCHPDIRVKVFEISETYACLIIAVLNFFTGICQAVMFIIFGIIIKSSSATEWQLISMISFILLNSTTTVYEIWSSARTEMYQPDNFLNIQNTIYQQSLEHQELESRM